MTDLDRLVALHEFEPLARLRMDAVAWDNVAGGAWDELGLAENDAASLVFVWLADLPRHQANRAPGRDGARPLENERTHDHAIKARG